MFLLKASIFLLKYVVSFVCALADEPSGGQGNYAYAKYSYIYESDCGPAEIHLSFSVTLLFLSLL